MSEYTHRVLKDEPIEAGAEISADGVYRYTLWRMWDVSKPLLRFVMLNPSTADAKTDDPTIRKCMGFARRLGYGGIVILNVFAYRSRDPRKLVEAKVAGINIVGSANTGTFARELRGDVIVGWGAWGNRPELREDIAHASTRIREAIPLTGAHGRVLCLGRTSDGQPRHPLMLSYETPLEEFAL